MRNISLVSWEVYTCWFSAEIQELLPWVILTRSSKSLGLSMVTEPHEIEFRNGLCLKMSLWSNLSLENEVDWDTHGQCHALSLAVWLMPTASAASKTFKNSDSNHRTITTAATATTTTQTSQPYTWDSHRAPAACTSITACSSTKPTT